MKLLRKINRVSLCSLIILTPLIFYPYIENAYTLIKFSVLRFAGGIFVITSIAILFREKNKNPENKINLIDFSVLLFSVSVLLSTIFSQNFLISILGQPVRQIGSISYSFLFLLYLFSRKIFADEKFLKAFILCFEIAAVIASAYSILQSYHIEMFSMQPLNSRRPVSTLGNGVFLGAYLVLIFPFSFFNAAEKKNIFLRYLFPAVILAGIVFSQTRSAYIAVSGTVLVITIIFIVLNFNKSNHNTKKIFPRIIFFSVLIIAAASIIFIFTDNAITRRVQSIFTNFNTNPRWLLWSESFEILKKYPLTGSGISVFSNVFEFISSQRLKLDDVRGIYDHAHNNFLHTLFTMGVIGLGTYLLLMGSAITLSVKLLKQFSHTKKRRTLFFSVAAALTGYCFYGLTNFDDLNVQLNLFFILSVLSVKVSKNLETGIIIPKPIIKVLTSIKIPLYLLIIIFCLINIYKTNSNIKADILYSQGMRLSIAGRFTESIDKMNDAINTNYYNSSYKLGQVQNVYIYCISNPLLDTTKKNKLLNQCLDEIDKAERTHNSKLFCESYRALVYYSLNNFSKADSIRNWIYGYDSTMINFRINLARFYISTNYFDNARKEMDYIFSYDKENIEALHTAAVYCERLGMIDEAKKRCEKILSIQKDNPVALKYLHQLNTKQNQK